MVSENLYHDANTITLFNSKFIAHLKKKFGPNKIKKVMYFSDGAGSQYENRFDLVILVILI